MKLRAGAVLVVLVILIAGVLLVRLSWLHRPLPSRDAAAPIVSVSDDFEPTGAHRQRVDALVALAAADPSAALAQAMEESDPMLRAYLVAQIAISLADSDPVAAMALAAGLTDRMLGEHLARIVIMRVAEAGEDALIALLTTADLSGMGAGAGPVVELARSRPNLMLELLESFPPPAQRNARDFALRALAETDPFRVLDILQAMPSREVSDSVLLRSLAEDIARQNPEAALAWLESLSGDSGGAFAAVLSGIAAFDPDRALALLARRLGRPYEPGRGMPGAASMLGGEFVDNAQDNEERSQLLDLFASLDIGDNERSGLLSSAVSAWERDDSAAAFDWVVANAGQLDGLAWVNIASNLVRRDPELAIALLDDLPAERRDDWASGIANSLTNTDFDAAVEFAESLRGQPGYGRALGVVLMSQARDDPAGAARRAGEAGESVVSAGASAIIAERWASEDPRAAADWANSLQSQPHRTESVGSAALTWGGQDYDQAESWVLGLEAGPARDAGLAGVLRAGAANGSVDVGLLGSFSSERARNGAMANAVLQLAVTDPDEAQRLLAQYVTDPDLRGSIERMLEGFDGTSVPVIVY